jgi:hypothetical protein
VLRQSLRTVDPLRFGGLGADIGLMKSDSQVVEVVETAGTGRGRSERVLFETDRHLLIGDVRLPSTGFQGRFSDAINREDVAFIPLTDVELVPLGEGQTTRHEFLLLAKAHIRLAHPASDPS